MGCSKPETRCSKPETRNQKPETRNQKCARRSSGFWFLVSAFWFLVSAFCFYAVGLPRNHRLIRSHRDGGFGGGSAVAAGSSVRRFDAVTVIFFVARVDSSSACWA